MKPLHIRFYTSDYGYGHAARDIALIRRLHRDLGAEVSVRTEYPAAFMERSLPGVPVTRGENDIGVVMQNVSVDAAATEERLRAWIQSWESYVAAEERICREQGVDLIISDIAPQPFLVADDLGIPGIALSNFSWHLIYTHLFGTTPETERIREAYRCATGALVLPLHEEMGVFRERRETGLLCREVTRNRKEMRRRFGLSDDDLLVYLGTGWSVEAFPGGIGELVRQGATVLVSSNRACGETGVIHIPQDETETQDYIAMCDLVVTKPGYSTVSEAMCARVPMLLYRRERFAEDEFIIDPIEKMGVGRALSWQDFQTREWTDDLDTLLSLKENYTDGTFKRDGAEDCMEYIRAMV
ncbi:MAG: hypothetical protein PHP59_11600 [Methanofollis sp.]|uniref:hypothetical protein n=1 Tax=Methanofollis sp. TaxID=2052835 RepID=UPI00261279A4|nr:hypothetical protein [Methanofollis sp.]MDD4256003.1 hypothetical protein [Methanofollis sp.]